MPSQRYSPSGQVVSRRSGEVRTAKPRPKPLDGARKIEVVVAAILVSGPI